MLSKNNGTVSASNDLVISAANSYDQDSTTTQLMYSWSCDKCDFVAANQPIADKVAIYSIP